MIEKVEKTLIKFSMVSPGDDVTVALSGGADSVALLFALCSIKDNLGITVRAAHLNHMLRGAEADRDETFSRELCLKLGVPFVSERIDVPAESAASGESFELAARRIRYDFLERVSTGKIATAHTASDNAETVLFNISRGCGIKGVSGIPPVRGRFIRPLIECTRTEIEKYCADNLLDFMTDSTNLIDDCTRNVIRHRVIPVMREINPSFDDSVCRLSELASDDCDFIDSYADGIFKKTAAENSISIDECCHNAIASRLLRRLYGEVSGCTADRLHINEIIRCLGGNTRVALPGGFFAEINGRTVKILNNDVKPECKYNVSVKQISKKIFDSEIKVNKMLLKNAVDCDKIIGRLDLRTRTEGDFIRLYGRNVTKSLKKLFNEEKIPAEKRNLIPVAADSDGVVWIYGLGVSERVCIDGGTENVCVFSTEYIGL